MELNQQRESVLSHIVSSPADISASVQQCYDLICLNKEVCGALEEESKSTEQLYKPLVVVGPSGSGKGTLISALTSQYPDKFGFSVSYTTRQPRKGEVDGQHYNFVTKERFREMIANDEFIEHCEVHTNLYGTAKEQITKTMAQKKIPLLDIDVQGALKFQKAFPNSNFVAILAPSSQILEQRLISRGTENAEQLAIRVENSKEESQILLEKRQYFNYRIINSDLAVSKSTFLTLCAALYSSELTGKQLTNSAKIDTVEKPKSQIKKNLISGALWTLTVGLSLIAFHDHVLVKYGKRNK